ncbi:MAG: Crp/Fnr family transcriptional regulator [Gammaproteobacteria bacterium]|nr:Crp/Fnr family transcriptional regulator [Gammaproteobacteria bacterium]
MKTVLKSYPNIAGPCLHKPEELRCAACILDTSYYFGSLSISAKRQLQQYLHFKTFNKKDFIYREEQTCQNLYILITGEVKIYKSMSNGKQQIHKLAMIPGDLIACEDLYLNNHGSSAEALSDVSVCYIKRADFQTVANMNTEVSDTMLQHMSRNLNSYIQHISNLGQKSALERVASYLLHLHDTHHEGNLENDLVSDSLSRVELADMLGITQRTLIRGLKKLEADGYIKLAKDGFVIVQLDALTCISTGCSGHCQFTI